MNVENITGYFFMGRLPPEDSGLVLLAGINVLREKHPAAYERAKARKVTVSLSSPDESSGRHMRNYRIKCTIDGMMGGSPTNLHISATMQQVDEMLKRDIEFLREQGFTNIEYVCNNPT